jgi:hypothetical protein
MDAKALIPESLNEQQLLMLRLLKKPLPEASFTQIRQLAVKLLAAQLDEIVGDWEDKNGITEEYYNEAINQHFRSGSKK